MRAHQFFQSHQLKKEATTKIAKVMLAKTMTVAPMIPKTLTKVTKETKVTKVTNLKLPQIERIET